MFQAVIKRAQLAVDKTIDQAINRTVMLVPFVIAGGFATAALSNRLTMELGPEYGHWAMAGVFTVIGAITAAIVASRQQPSPVAAAAETPAAEAASSQVLETKDAADPIPEIDREMIMAALTSIAPLALPQLLRLLVRNLPILVVIIAGLFVVTRPGEEPGEADADVEKAAAAA